MTRIAILSDIHFGKFARCETFSVPGETIQDNSVGDMPLEDGLVDLMKEMNPQYIFLAGDLTSIGEPQEFWYCERKIISIADQVGIKHGNIICCLGNHDIDWNIFEIANKKINKGTVEEVAQIIKAKYENIAASSAINCLDEFEMPSGENKGPAPYAGIYESDSFIVYVLNTGAFCTKEQAYSHGKLSIEQLNWFKKESEVRKDISKVKIVLMHHHPINYAYPVPTQDISVLEEGPEFVDIAIRNGINIVIHGHRHHPRVETVQRNFGGPITFICAGSLAVNTTQRKNGEIPNTIHFLDIEQEKDFYVLHNFKYTGLEGWKPMICSGITPLDQVMNIGKIIPEEEINKSIEVYKDSLKSFIRIEWEQLDDCLKFMTYESLNSKIRERLNDVYIINGRFPEPVMLMKKGEV